MATHSSILAWRIPWTEGAWQATVHGGTNSLTRLTDYTMSSQAWQERSCFKKHPPSDFPRNLPFADEGPWDDRLHARSSQGERAIELECLCPAASLRCPSVPARAQGHRPPIETENPGLTASPRVVWVFGFMLRDESMNHSSVMSAHLGIHHESGWGGLSLSHTHPSTPSYDSFIDKGTVSLMNEP